MTHAEALRESVLRLELAITEDNLELAHQVMDEQLILLQQIVLENNYSTDLIDAAKDIFDENKEFMVIVSKKKKSNYSASYTI